MKQTHSSEDGSEDHDSAGEYSPESDSEGELWCPHCGAEMYGGASRCPSCGDYVTPGAKPAGRLPAWIWIGLALLGLALAAGLASSLR